ncbi:gas vesicle protein GvpG [Polymorphospora sp. NPDC050346]|uniref:gas vesicle protein GvpG n=1 Tax=Polymorphospora sp. NPDC050346 TaxID=3155780 RepID=UPI0033F28C47
MDILWALLTLPYAPVRGLTAAVKAVAREAESQQHNPVDLRREPEELDRAAGAGEISPRERDRAQRRELDRLTARPGGVGVSPYRVGGTARRPARARRASPVRRRAAGRLGQRGQGR